MKPTQKFTFSINPLIIIIALFIVIIGMLAMWRPWEAKTERTITTTGQAEVEGTPDEFVFTPYFQRIGDDSSKLKAELDSFGNQLLTEVTKLGVEKDDITLHANNSNQSSEPYRADDTTVTDKQKTVTLSVTIKAPSQELAQKVQNYLATTDAKGQLTSMPSFSKQKREDLEDTARDNATKNAREKAERSAKNLGGNIGKVITIKEGGSSAPVYPLSGAAEDTSTKSSLPVTPGKDSVSMSVEVVFELRS